jgi:glycosyltransferase involved in cell wall biosynthesis
MNIDSYLVIPGYSPQRIYFFLKAYLSALFFRKNNSLIVIQRVHSNFIYATLLKILVKLQNHDTVYDLDDADYLEHNPKTIYFFVKNCEKISAGSQAIARHLKQFNKNVTHITSPVVDLGIFKRERNLLFTIGWIGGFGWGHRDSLINLAFPALRELSFKFKLILIGVLKKDDVKFILDYFNEIPNIEIEIPQGIDWNDEKDIQNRITSFDIGIATLLNKPIQTSKSGIKVKQYMNNGIPVLSTDLPENNSIVIDGKNGYLCSNANDFKNRIYEFYSMSDDDFSQFSINAKKSIVNFDHYKYFKDFAKMKNNIV